MIVRTDLHVEQSLKKEKETEKTCSRLFFLFYLEEGGLFEIWAVCGMLFTRNTTEYWVENFPPHADSGWLFLASPEMAHAQFVTLYTTGLLSLSIVLLPGLTLLPHPLKINPPYTLPPILFPPPAPYTLSFYHFCSTIIATAFWKQISKPITAYRLDLEVNIYFFFVNSINTNNFFFFIVHQKANKPY